MALPNLSWIQSLSQLQKKKIQSLPKALKKRMKRQAHQKMMKIPKFNFKVKHEYSSLEKPFKIRDYQG
jgi:hypothetical protein